MSEHMSQEEYVGLVRHQIVTLANEALSGALSCLEAGIAILQLASEAEFPANDADLEVLSNICEETDALPIGRVRALWSAEALERLQPDIERAEMWARPFAIPAYRSVVERFHA